MNNNHTPLRYPGGKSILTKFFISYIAANKIENPIYVEPYCGGAGAAINLLLNNDVSEIYLNDLNYSIYSFWYSLKHYGSEIIDRLDKTEITLDEWRNQRSIFKSLSGKTLKKDDLINNGFATLFMNRCNRSGILNAGPIGGQSENGQLNATYKIDARFEKKKIKEKLLAIIDRKDSIHVSNMDALGLMSKLQSIFTTQQKGSTFVYLDPPYYKQGSSLYLNFYKHEDHKRIAEYLADNCQFKWILSYDNVTEIRNLYQEFPQYSFYLNYSAQDSKLGNELLIHSKSSSLPSSPVIRMNKNNKAVELSLI